MTPKAVLVGLPGAGKTTTGKRLAKILAVTFADSDDMVEEAAGRGVREIFADCGEAGFRAIEAEVVLAALRDFDGVLALGGGAVTTSSTQHALAESGVPVVLLDAPVSTLALRVGDGRTRPLLSDDPPARLRALADQRERSFAAVATMTVETELRTPGQVAARIAARLHETAHRR